MNNANGQERIISTVPIEGLQPSVYQNPHDVKKLRNRLAQRKHRARAKRAPSQSTGQDVVEAGGSGTLESYHRPSFTDSRGQECRTNTDPAVEAMDFIIPAASESSALQNAKASTNNNADLKQFMITPMSNITSYDGANSNGFFPSEDMRVNQDSAILQPRFLPQTQYNETQDDHDFASLYEATQRQNQFQQLQLQLQLQPAQQLHSNARHETDILNSHTHMRHSKTQSLSNDNLAKISQLQFSTTAPNFDTTGQGSGLDGNKNNDNTNNDNTGSSSTSSGTSSGTSSSGNSRHHSPEITEPTIFSPDDLEGRFEALLKAVAEAGFESIDDAATKYYTSSFEEGSFCYWAQERSRRRSLITFLENLHRSTKHWNERDVQGYKNHIGAVAEKWYVDEFQNAKKELRNHGKAIDRSGGRLQRREDSGHVIKESEANEILREKKILVREKMTETWSLLFELTQKAGLQQPRGSQAVDAFLLLLLDKGKHS